MTYLNTDRMNVEQRQRVDRWLVANGARWHADLEPIVVRGRCIEYTPLVPRRAHSTDYGAGWFRDTWRLVPESFSLGGCRWEPRARRRHRLRLRVPLADVR